MQQRSKARKNWPQGSQSEIALEIKTIEQLQVLTVKI